MGGLIGLFQLSNSKVLYSGSGILMVHANGKNGLLIITDSSDINHYMLASFSYISNTVPIISKLAGKMEVETNTFGTVAPITGTSNSVYTWRIITF